MVKPSDTARDSRSDVEEIHQSASAPESSTRTTSGKHKKKKMLKTSTPQLTLDPALFPLTKTAASLILFEGANALTGDTMTNYPSVAPWVLMVTSLAMIWRFSPISWMVDKASSDLKSSLSKLPGLSIYTGFCVAIVLINLITIGAAKMLSIPLHNPQYWETCSEFLRSAYSPLMWILIMVALETSARWFVPKAYWTARWALAEEVSLENVHHWMTKVEQQEENSAMWARRPNGDIWHTESVYHAKDQVYLVSDVNSLHICKSRSCRAAKNESEVVHSTTWKVINITTSSRWYSRTDSLATIITSLRTLSLLHSLAKKAGIRCKNKRQTLFPVTEDQRREDQLRLVGTTTRTKHKCAAGMLTYSSHGTKPAQLLDPNMACNKAPTGRLSTVGTLGVRTVSQDGEEGVTEINPPLCDVHFKSFQDEVLKKAKCEKYKKKNECKPIWDEDN